MLKMKSFYILTLAVFIVHIRHQMIRERQNGSSIGHVKPHPTDNVAHTFHSYLRHLLLVHTSEYMNTYRPLAWYFREVNVFIAFMHIPIIPSDNLIAASHKMWNSGHWQFYSITGQLDSQHFFLASHTEMYTLMFTIEMSNLISIQNWNDPQGPLLSTWFNFNANSISNYTH